MNNKGFTLIEFIIVFITLVIFLVIAIHQFGAYKKRNNDINQGPSVIQETNYQKKEKDDGSVCKGGYKFIFTDGRYIQVLSSSNGGVSCLN
ncbi:prepilin-type N-terminal cleavage/methylation domain-containing protein [Candidatus Dojkabacteria bacterium]|jgi:Tfp pilus assembly protein PilE|nr:prepilin-type N-terminal cleavage/methylation domain-containing protein [Candidatus Dojkabacteria bacterium]